MIRRKDDFARKLLTDDVYRKRKAKKKGKSRKRIWNRNKKLDLNFRKEYTR